jgi:hypothetical protein
MIRFYTLCPSNELNCEFRVDEHFAIHDLLLFDFNMRTTLGMKRELLRTMETSGDPIDEVTLKNERSLAKARWGICQRALDKYEYLSSSVLVNDSTNDQKYAEMHSILSKLTEDYSALYAGFRNVGLKLILGS